MRTSRRGTHERNAQIKSKFGRRTFVPGHGQPPVALTERAVPRRRRRGTQSAKVITRPCGGHCSPALTAGTFPSSPVRSYRGLHIASSHLLPSLPHTAGPPLATYDPDPPSIPQRRRRQITRQDSRRFLNRRQDFIPIPRPFPSVPGRIHPRPRLRPPDHAFLATVQIQETHSSLPPSGLLPLLFFFFSPSSRSRILCPRSVIRTCVPPFLCFGSLRARPCPTTHPRNLVRRTGSRAPGGRNGPSLMLPAC